MKNKHPVYEPREDTFLITNECRKNLKGNILEIGIGTGYVSNELSKKTNIKSIDGIDINKDAINYAKKRYKDKKLNFFQSNLFSNIKKRYDHIICNPPYLPQDKNIIDPALYGGKKGYEFIINLLNQVSNYLNDNGSLILLFSSLSKKEIIENSIEKNLLTFKKLKEKYIGNFETLYIYKIKKRIELIELEKNKITNIQFHEKGKRGLVLKAIYKKNTIAIKLKNQKSKTDTIFNEINILKKVNKLNIGPKLIKQLHHSIIMEFIDGIKIIEYIKINNKNKTIKIIKDILDQCYRLDQNKIDKKEMTNPYKHILIKNDNPILIDFERSRLSKKPNNVNSLCQFLTKDKMSKILKEKRITINKTKLTNLLKQYKKKYDKKNFKEITKSF